MMTKLTRRTIVFFISALLIIGAASFTFPVDANPGKGAQGYPAPPAPGDPELYVPLVMKLYPAPYAPLFVGLNLQWTSAGYGRGSHTSPNWDAGYYLTRNLDMMTDADTIRSNNYGTYSPNPLGWTDDAWYSYYSVSSLAFKSSSSLPDPDWKWGFWDFILPRSASLSNGATYMVSGQPFMVSGPFAGTTAFGQAVSYWRLVNQTKFLEFDDGSGWQLYAHPNEIILLYDAGATRLLLDDNEVRHYYYNGSLFDDTVQWIDSLTATNSWPGALGNSQALGVFLSIAPHLQPETTGPGQVCKHGRESASDMAVCR